MTKVIIVNVEAKASLEPPPVVLNSLDFTELCLGSPFSNTTPGYSRFGSTGGDLEILCFWGALSTTETFY